MKPVLFHNVQCWRENLSSQHDGHWEDVDLIVARGCIAHIDRPGSATSIGRCRVFDWPDVCVLPGLINAHDHLELNLLPRLGRGPYANSYQWSQSILHPSEPPMADVLAIPLRERLLMGGYKNLLSGVTTVCHHNPYHRRVFDRLFPVKVVKDYQWAHSLGFGDDLELSYRKAAINQSRPPEADKGAVEPVPWIIHAAEGIDDQAASEIAALDERGLLADNTVIVHGVAIDEHDIALMEQRGASLIWCPSSNLFLYGTTAPVDKLLDRVGVALGSDSTLSADGDLLDELRAAARQNLWPRHRLIELVTNAAAGILRLKDGRGSLTCGAPADLLFVPAGAADPSEALLTTRSSDIQLVMRDGVPGYGDVRAAAIFEASHHRVSYMTMDGVNKLVAGPFDDLLKKVAHALGRTTFFGHEFSLGHRLSSAKGGPKRSPGGERKPVAH